MGLVEALGLGDMPALGAVPERMRAQLIRPERYGEPMQAFREEEVLTPRPRAGEVLVYVMAAGVNYNNVWAALGRPVDVVAARQKAGEQEPFHIGGSDASGIV
jgi:crotonyl-CoA carboxylase/reductase